MDLDSRLNGAWFIHPSVDIIRALADIIRDIASEYSIAEENMVFYGSSLGGFGALMAAACFSEVHAVAEVPQLDFRLWHRRAVLDVEKYLLNGADISAFTKQHPERVSVLHRFIKENRIPQFTIITNGTDFRIREQRLFMKWVSRSKLPKGGLNLLIETDGTAGHNVLEKGDVLPFIVPKNRYHTPSPLP